MNQSTTVLDIDFGMSQLSGNRELLFKLLRKFANEYRTLDADLQALVAKHAFNDAYSLVHTLKGVTGNLGLCALHEASKPIESGFRNEQQVAEEYPSFLSVLNQTLSEVDSLVNSTEEVASSSQPSNAAAAQHARKQLMTALKASEFIAQETLDEWLDALALTDAKRTAIIDAVEELDYEEAIIELENS